MQEEAAHLVSGFRCVDLKEMSTAKDGEWAQLGSNLPLLGASGRALFYLFSTPRPGSQPGGGFGLGEEKWRDLRVSKSAIGPLSWQLVIAFLPSDGPSVLSRVNIFVYNSTSIWAALWHRVMGIFYRPGPSPIPITSRDKSEKS